MNKFYETKFSIKWVAKAVFIVAAILGIPLAVYLLVISRPVKIAWASIVHDRQEHYLECDGLPFYPQVEKALLQHADFVEKLKQGGAVDVVPEKTQCSIFEGGVVFVKGDILITYRSRAQRRAIERIIGNNFFGIAYRGQQVK